MQNSFKHKEKLAILGVHQRWDTGYGWSSMFSVSHAQDLPPERATASDPYGLGAEDHGAGKGGRWKDLWGEEV